LLSWITRSGAAVCSCCSWTSSCFNPCCHGSPARAPTTERGLTGTVGFNPCCHGSPARAVGPPPLSPPRQPVSILVVMDHPLGPLNGCPTDTLAVGFNPCCHGSPARGATPRPRTTGPAGRFNPCCHGSPARASVDAVVTSPPYEFQSLLSWITRSGYSATAWYLLADPKFQSLLSWITRSGVTSRTKRQKRLPGFNPCCHGSPARARSDVRHQKVALSVSILVVMDHPLGPQT